MTKWILCALVGLSVSYAATAAAEPPTAVARQPDVRLVPAVKNGKFHGFKAYAIKAGSRFARAGLQNGDTIVAIDDVAMRAPDEDSRILKAITDLTITVVRKSTTTLRLKLSAR